MLDESTKAKHTPGPWRADDGPALSYDVVDPTGECVAQCWHRGNAALIAAAPQLLAALEAILATPPGTDPVEIVRADDLARAAIAAAKGGAR